MSDVQASGSRAGALNKNALRRYLCAAVPHWCRKFTKSAGEQTESKKKAVRSRLSCARRFQHIIYNIYDETYNFDWKIMRV